MISISIWWMSEWMKACLYIPLFKLRWINSSGSIFKGFCQNWSISCPPSPILLLLTTPQLTLPGIFQLKFVQWAAALLPMNCFPLHLQLPLLGQRTWRLSVEIPSKKEMDCLEFPLTSLHSPNKTGQLTVFTSPSRQLPLHSFNWSCQGDANNGATGQGIRGYKPHAGIMPWGFTEASGRCHRGDWLWRKLTEIINFIPLAGTEVFVKMSGSWIVPIHLLFDAFIFLKACILCDIGRSSIFFPPSQSSVRKYYMLVVFGEWVFYT